MAVDLAGGLHELRPAPLLEFLAATRKTGLLQVTSRTHKISVWLADGVTVAADSTGPDADLLDQLVDLLRTPTGAFAFTEGESPRPDQAYTPEPDLLPRAVERLHEWTALADAVPSLSLVVKLLNTDDDEVSLSAAAWSVSVAVSGGHGSVASAAKHLKWSAFKTCKAVRELVDAGRATLVPPPKRRRSAKKTADAMIAGGVWHPANQPLWPGAGSAETDRFSAAWAYEE